MNISKIEAHKAREKYLKKKWKKKFLKQALDLTPLKFRKEHETLLTPKNLEVTSTYLTGEAGVGKTIFAAFLFLKAIKQLYYKRGYFPSISAHFVNFPDMFTEMQANMKDFGHIAIFKKYLDCDILVLDDLGTKKTTDWVGDVIYQIINRRYENQKFTIITSNYSLKELAEKLQDDRIIRRIEETYKVAEKKHFKKS